MFLRMIQGIRDRQAAQERARGRIRLEKCRTHWHAQWSVPIIPPPGFIRNVYSPYFGVEGRYYAFRLCSPLEFDDVSVFFTRLGPCPKMRVWTGVRRGDGACDLGSVTRRRLAPFVSTEPEDKQQTMMWTCPRSFVHSEYLNAEGRLVVFAYVQVGRKRRRRRKNTKSTRCGHDFLDFASSGTGALSEETCGDHKYVEWNFNYSDALRRNSVNSATFRFGWQSYSLESHADEGDLIVRAYRIGPAETGEARWCMGFKMADGTAPCHRTTTGRFDLRRPSQLWKRGRTSRRLSASVLKKYHLAADGSITLFFRITLRRNKSGLETCSHFVPDLSRHSSGTVMEERRTQHTKLEWDVDFEADVDVYRMSPTFHISGQKFLLELRGPKPRLTLFRQGPSVGRRLRWWAAAEGCNQHHGSKCGELEEKICETWMPEKLFKFKVGEGKVRLRIHFLYAHDDSNPESVERVVFKVGEEEFPACKSVLKVRVPVFEYVFQHDNLENRTGVVRIEDCEPEVFRMFLAYVDSGDTGEEELRADHALQLYVVADKYLFQTLKSNCLNRLKEGLSRSNYFEVVCMAVKYGEESLLKSTAIFLLKHRQLFSTEEWLEFWSKKPRLAETVLPQLFQMLKECSAVMRFKPRSRPKPIKILPLNSLNFW